MHERTGPVITIDGPAGAGKSSAAKLLASRLGYTYLDTGALYRAVAWQAKAEGIDTLDVKQVEKLLDNMSLHLTVTQGQTFVSVNSKDVTDQLRSPEISQWASALAANSRVRDWLLPYQKNFSSMSGIVAEGRDMGTRVFPNADVKFFLDADLETRAMRRFQDEVKADHQVGFQEVQHEVRTRDARDRTRDIAPLKPAPDAVRIDSSKLTIDQVVDSMMEKIPSLL